jgi:hypothetical protein
MPINKAPQTTVEEKLEEMLVHMRKMDKRDRVRLWGGFVRSIISLIPLVLFLWSGWYFIQHGPELMKQVADVAASSAAKYTQEQGAGVAEKIMERYGIPQQN